MKRWFVLAIAAAGAVVGSKVLIENVLGFDLQPVATAWIAEAGAGSAVAVVALLALDLFIPVPSSVVMVLSGAAFGIAWGSLLSLVGSMCGAWVGFELARRYGRAVSARMVGGGELEQLERVFDRHGVVTVIVTRALPIVMETASVVAGLSRMPRSTFLLASLVGTAPIAVIYAYAGALSRQTGSLVPAVVILLAVAAAAALWFRARLAARNGAPASSAGSAAVEVTDRR